MRVFVTGATGWVGSTVVKELVEAGHQVSGLSRSDGKSSALEEIGAQVVRGTLDDLPTLRGAASASDAVIHIAFNHDFSKYAENAAQDVRAIEALGEALKGSQRPLLITSGLASLAAGRLATEGDVPVSDPSLPRRSEQAARALAARGIRASTVRLATSVHGVGDRGFVSMLIGLAREKGVSAYVGDGRNRWPAVHRLDAGRLYRLALEHGGTEPIYHGVAEEGVAIRDIAEVIGRRLGVPVESRPAEHFGFLAKFAVADMPTSSAHTREAIGWQPTGAGLITDLDQPGYFNE
ncbi:MAG: SDR family oxidoreductase [Pseudomonadota bacterium]|nr:SDR family oxidoreductase [Pseudomonadota bacterium]